MPSAPTRSSTPRSVPDTTGDLAELTGQLVAIDSTNPDLVPDGAGEGEIAAFVAELASAGGPRGRAPRARARTADVIGIARGTGGGRSLLLNAHMDTVGVAGMEAPFTPDIEDGRLYGRGAGDMKGSLAAIMLVGAAAVRDGLARRRHRHRRRRRGVRQRRHRGPRPRADRRRGDRHRADRGGRRVAHKGFVALRDRDGGLRRARLPPRPRRRRDRARWGRCSAGIAALDDAAPGGHGPSAARHRLTPRLA